MEQTLLPSPRGTFSLSANFTCLRLSFLFHGKPAVYRSENVLWLLRTGSRAGGVNKSSHSLMEGLHTHTHAHTHTHTHTHTHKHT